MSLSKLSETSFDAEEKIWKAQKSPKSARIFNVDIGLGRLIMEVLKTTPERITQVFADNGAEMTCYDMRVRTFKIASYLIKRGYKQNDIAGLFSENCENLVPVFFACLILGMPINTLSPMRDNVYTQNPPKVIFCDAQSVEAVKKALNTIEFECEIITLIEKVPNYVFVDDLLANSKVSVDEFIYPDLVNIADSIAAILTSSGSTGAPKAICKSHRQLICHHTDRHFVPSSEQEVSFNFSPVLAGIVGLYFLTVGSLYGAKRIITRKPSSNANFIDIVERFKVTTTLFFTSYLAAILEDPYLNGQENILKSLKLVTVIGSHVPIALRLSARIHLPNAKLVVVYGASEFDMIADNLDMDSKSSVGQLYDSKQAIVIDDDEKRLGPNEVGEICLRVEAPFIGYFGNPKLTEESFIGEFFKTGDSGYFDENCYLHIFARKKEMIRYEKTLVSPTEIEDIINSLAGVATSCVVGVLDEKTGNDLIFAFVKKCISSINEKDIVDYVNAKVIDAKKLRGGVHFVETFPLTPSGKFKRFELIEMAKKIQILMTKTKN